MLTLSYGYLKPETGDKGSIWFPALELDIQKLNDHTHNGVNSAQIPSSSVLATSQIVTNAGWAEVTPGSGTYKQTVTMPGVMLFDQYGIDVYEHTSGKKLYLTVRKVLTNTFDVYINDNSKQLRVKYV